MTRFRSFLFGIILGQVLMIPWLIKYIKNPRIEALPVPNNVFDQQFKTRTFVIKAVPLDKVVLLKQGNKEVYNLVKTKGDLVIYIMPEDLVRKEYAKRYEPNDYVIGFYDRKEHVIYCIDSVDILIHELRHIFEGHYHR
jgi:hypothetical protein